MTQQQMSVPGPGPGVTLEEAAREVVRCARDFRYYLRTYVKVQDRTSKATISWEWWPMLHDQMCEDAEHERLLIWLKARQVSGSWFWVARASWLCLFHENAGVLILSQGQDDANKFLDKVKFVLDNLPPWMQQPRSVNNESEIEFAIMKSQIQALPATENAGRGTTASLIIVDEAAFHPYAATNYVAYKPAIDAGGQLVLLSTANGVGNFFHKMYVEAREGVSGFVPRFFSWRSRPGRDDRWLEEQRRALRAAGEEHKLKQEYPETDDEAFLTSGNLRFNVEALQVHRARAALVQPLPAAAIMGHLQFQSTGAVADGGGSSGYNLLASLVQSGQLKIWQLPQPGVPYVAGSDVAEGLARGDFSCTNILAARTLEHVLSLHGHWTPAVFAQLSAVVAWWYNTALWGIERNNHGHTVLHVADQQLRYPRLYWHDDPVQQTDRQRRNLNASAFEQRPARKLGWPTTASTKPGLIDDLDETITAFALSSLDAAFWGECLTYIINERGGTEAGEGSYDDRVMAMAIARRMAQQPGATTARPALLMTGPPYQQYQQQQQVLGRPRPKPDGRSTQYEWRS